MRENISKLDNKIVSLVFIIPCLFLVGFVVYSIATSPGLTELIKKRDLDENIHGVIDSLYLDVQNHNTTYAILSDKKEFPINGNWEQHIDVGDSISKNKNSFIFKIFKKNKTKIILDYRSTYKVTK